MTCSPRDAFVHRSATLHPAGFDYLSDEEYAALQAHLAQDPECGEVVPGSGGATESIPKHVLRKIRQELGDDQD